VTISAPPPSDGVKPTVTITSVTPSTIWSPNGKKLPVTIKGTAKDNVGVTQLTLNVADEYKLDQPTLAWPPNSNATNVVSFDPSTGAFTFVVNLTASRLGSDKDGRVYTLNVSASDAAGNVGTAAPVKVTAHDASK
jgi:hypothetical protein